MVWSSDQQTFKHGFKQKHMKGTIFNIMRFSTHDGPGIRTTVFLKGCPLSCWWCHNPENWQHVPKEVFLPDRCRGCGLCIQNCPEGALSRSQAEIIVDLSLCRHCSRCVATCPMEARESTGWDIGVPELVKSIERDIAFFDQSGGGVTFSGGEPLGQPDFLLAMLKECGRLEIHRTVDTSGFADLHVLLEVARHAELFLYDLKVLDPARHREHTGVDNARILSNLRQLSAAGAEIVIRIPLIPGVNDDAVSLAAAGEFIAGLPRRHEVNILPFHRGAGAKYAKLGLYSRGDNITPSSPEQTAEAVNQLKTYGLAVSLGG